MTDAVYLAVGARPPRAAAVRRLCRRLGLGLISVADGRAEVVLDPLPYRPQRDRRRTGRLLGEHQRRVGDPTAGGSVRRPIMTAYRQQAIRCLALLERGPLSLRAMRATADVPDASSILQRDVYGWFERVARGTYTLTPRGFAALEEVHRESGGGVRGQANVPRSPASAADGPASSEPHAATAAAGVQGEPTMSFTSRSQAPGASRRR
jgi:hypothetical protein